MNVILPLALGGAFVWAFFKSNSTAAPDSPEDLSGEGHVGFRVMPNFSGIPADDQDAAPETLGAHHLAIKFGTGKIHFTPEVMRYLATA